MDIKLDTFSLHNFQYFKPALFTFFLISFGQCRVCLHFDGCVLSWSPANASCSASSCVHYLQGKITSSQVLVTQVTEKYKGECMVGPVTTAVHPQLICRTINLA